MKKLVLPLSCLLLTVLFCCAFINLSSKKVEVEYQEAEIILPNGHIINHFVASDESGKVFVPYELMEQIIDEPLFWDNESKTLNIGTVPDASVMSDKLKIYHYGYDSVRAFLYCPDAKMNKTMTMGDCIHENGYSFTNVLTASFNLDEMYHHITGVLGCEDFKASSGQVDFYLDDNLIYSVALKADDLPQPIDLDVEGGTQLKLVFSQFKPDTQINFADVFIN